MDLKRNAILLVVILATVNLYSQDIFKDSLRISLSQADSLFLRNNVTLLAEKCNVEAAKAQILQARLFQNLNLSLSQNLVNPDYKTTGGRKWIDLSNNGEASIQVQKLFLMAGKRNKQISLAEASFDREGHTYFDLLRTLKFTLHTCFYNIHYLNRTLKVYDNEIASIRKLTEALQVQFEKEYISKNELLRLKSKLFSLENEKLQITNQLVNSMSDLNLLFHTSDVYYSTQTVDDEKDSFSPEAVKLQSLIDSAFQFRYDLRIAESDLKISKLNLSYQKSVAVPDITLSGGWDRNGSFIHNYNYLGVQFDLPFFNRNQGNIKSAMSQAESSRYKLLAAGDQVKADVINAFSGAIETDKIYKAFDSKFISDLEDLNRGLVKNYRERNMSLIEFLDYYDAYKENAIQLNNLLYNRHYSIENINFSVGNEIIKN